MRAKLVTLCSALVVAVVILSAVFHAQASSPSNLAMPDLSGHCLNKGATVTTALTASNLTSIQSWQANVTFDYQEITPMSIALGTPFTGQNTIAPARNGTGYYLIGFTYYNGAGPYSSTSQVTLVTFTWKTTVYHATVFFHIVTLSENPSFGTRLLGSGLTNQSYTTTDGFLGCQEAPGR